MRKYSLSFIFLAFDKCDRSQTRLPAVSDTLHLSNTQLKLVNGQGRKLSRRYVGCSSWQRRFLWGNLGLAWVSVSMR